MNFASGELSSIKRGEVGSRLPQLLAWGLLIVSLAGWTADEQHTAQTSRPTVSVADQERTVMRSSGCRWLATISPSTDLPQFVEHINDVNFKLGLRGTIRMETPVLYFSLRDISMRGVFLQGLVAECRW